MLHLEKQREGSERETGKEEREKRKEEGCGERKER